MGMEFEDDGDPRLRTLLASGVRGGAMATTRYTVEGCCAAGGDEGVGIEDKAATARCDHRHHLVMSAHE